MAEKDSNPDRNDNGAAETAGDANPTLPNKSPAVGSHQEAHQITPPDESQVEDWGTASDAGGSTGVRDYDPNKDQDLHLLAMKILGLVAVCGIAFGSVLVAFDKELPDFIGVIVGSAVTAIAALFSKKG